MTGWSTQTDWESALQSENIQIETDSFELADLGGENPDTYGSYTVGEFPPSPYTFDQDGSYSPEPEIVDTVSLEDGQSFHFDGSVGSDLGGAVAIASSDMTTTQHNTVQMHYYETGSSAGGAMRWLDDSGNEVVSVGSGNPEVYAYGGNGEVAIESNPSPDYEEWRQIEVTIDWDNQTVDISWNDITGSTSSASVTNVPFVTSASNIATAEFIVDGRPSNTNMGGGGTERLDNFWYDKTTTL